jgi:hypothetical protein
MLSLTKTVPFLAAVMGIKRRASHMLGKHSTSELHLLPTFLSFPFIFFETGSC